MKQLTFALLLCLIFLQCISQNKFTSGYIVKSSGDTVHGYLQEETRKDLLFQVKFKSDINNSSFQTLTPSDVRAFKFESGNLYKTIKFVNTLEDSSKVQTCFALQLVEGLYNLFSYLASEKIYFVVTVNGASYMLYNFEYGVNRDLKTEGNYVSQLSLLDSACETYLLHPDLVIYNEKGMAKFITDLNKCVVPNAITANYYKKPKAQAQFVLFAGGFPLGNQNIITLEGMLRLVYPQISKKSSLNIGFRYYHNTKNETELNGGNIPFTRTYRDDFFSVPLSFQYNFLPGIIQPYFTGEVAGVYVKEAVSNIPSAIYIAPINQLSISVNVAAGVEGYITKRLFVKAEWRYEFNFKYLAIQYPTVGIAYKF